MGCQEKLFATFAPFFPPIIKLVFWQNFFPKIYINKCFSYEYLNNKKIGGFFDLNSLSNHKENTHHFDLLQEKKKKRKKDAETIHAIKNNILILNWTNKYWILMQK